MHRTGESGRNETMSASGLERQSQIARQKLARLGVLCAPGEDKQVLSGVLSFSGRLVAPVSAHNIRRAAFIIVLPDQLRFTEPPLDVIGPVAFGDVEALGALEVYAAALRRDPDAIEAHRRSAEILAYLGRRREAEAALAAYVAAGGADEAGVRRRLDRMAEARR